MTNLQTVMDKATVISSIINNNVIRQHGMSGNGMSRKPDLYLDVETVLARIQKSVEI